MSRHARAKRRARPDARPAPRAPPLTPPPPPPSDFLGQDEYAVGDFSKEVDRRVKEEVAKMREKDDYELGDLSVVLDGKVKELVCELSGKEEVRQTSRAPRCLAARSDVCAVLSTSSTSVHV